MRRKMRRVAVAGCFLSSASAAAQHIVATPAIDPSHVDKQVSSCHDFYQYANGGWLARSHPVDSTLSIPSEADGVLTELHARTHGVLLQVLEHARVAAPTTHDHTMRVVGNLYGSCLATDTSGTTSERAAHCYAATDSLFSHEIGQLFTQTVLSPAVMPQARRMIDDLHAALRARVIATRWSDSTKRSALTRLAALAFNVGAQPWTVDYAGLTLSPTDYVQNVRAVRDFQWKRLLRDGDATPGGESWLDPRVSNGFTDVSNFINVTTVWWQPPFFTPGGDPAENYAGIGFVIAHEMSHQFGSAAGQTGIDDRNEVDWVAPADTAAFTQQAQRLVQSYNSFKLSDSTRLNGVLTVKENFADLAGLTVAYTAFEQELQQVPRRRINGWTPEQRFFLAYANAMREKDNGVKNGDVHAPGRVRVNGVVENMPAFARAFGCKTGDAMVQPPERRVDIW